jgi:hypothetical protein
VVVAGKVVDTSLNGIMSATFWTQEDFGMEIMRKLCFICHTLPIYQCRYTNTYEGRSGGMEGASEGNIFCPLCI